MAAYIKIMFPLYHITLAAAPVMSVSPQDTNVFSHIRFLYSYKKEFSSHPLKNYFVPLTLSAPLGRPSPWKVFIGTSPGLCGNRGFVISPCRFPKNFSSVIFSERIWLLASVKWSIKQATAVPTWVRYAKTSETRRCVASWAEL